LSFHALGEAAVSDPPKKEKSWGEWLVDGIGTVVQGLINGVKAVARWFCRWAFVLATILIVIGIIVFIAGGGTAATGFGAPVGLPTAVVGYWIFVVGVVVLVLGLVCWLLS